MSWLCESVTLSLCGNKRSNISAALHLIGLKFDLYPFGQKKISQNVFFLGKSRLGKSRLGQGRGPKEYLLVKLSQQFDKLLVWKLKCKPKIEIEKKIKFWSMALSWPTEIYYANFGP